MMQRPPRRLSLVGCWPGHGVHGSGWLRNLAGPLQRHDNFRRFKHLSARVEEAQLSHKGVAEAWVVGRENPKWGKDVVAFE